MHQRPPRRDLCSLVATLTAVVVGVAACSTEQSAESTPTPADVSMTPPPGDGGDAPEDPPTSTAPTTASAGGDVPATAPDTSAGGDVPATAPDDTAGGVTVPDTSAGGDVPATVPDTSASPASTCDDDVPLGVTEYVFDAAGGPRDVRVFVPDSFAGVRLPVVLDWHGLGSNGPDQARYSGYETVAAEEGFIAVHPTGLGLLGGGPNYWQLFDEGGERDDVAFASALIDDLVANWCADPARVYSTGMSNGGFFTARLVCELADRIAAAASVAGLYHPDGCEPSRPVPYLGYHGTDDRVVPFDGSGESVLGDVGDFDLGVFFEQVMPEEFAEFAADAGCSLEPESAAVGEQVVRYDYTDCDDDAPLTFFEIEGGGHTWPSSPVATDIGGLGRTTTDVDATRDAWAFFEQHALPG